MKKVYVFGLMLLALAAFQGVASAKTVSGKIEAIDTAANKLSVTDAAGKVELSVSPATTYAGAASLADLTVGQEVSVETSEDGTAAISVNVTEPAQAEAALAQPAEPVAEEPAV